MDIENNFSQMSPPIFDGENYQAWAVRMTVHLEASDLWQAIDEDYKVAPLPANPTMARMKLHKEKTLRKSKAKACMFSVVSSSIFTKIMRLKTAKDIWDYLKKEYQGNERTRNMQILSLIREFEMMKMKEAETIKEYCNTLLGIANKIRLLDKDFPNDRIVQKILVTLPEKYESKISSLEESKDLSSISLAELVHALQAPEQRRMLRNEEPLEGVFQAKNLLSVGQLIEKGFKVLFEDQWCLIKDAQGKDVFKVKMRSKSFALNLMEEEQMAFSNIVSNAELWHKRLNWAFPPCWSYTYAET
nr:Retrovirus-related Pol polyprotein from transposon TNT 1-94 [Ipomoea batatas]